MAWKLKLVCQHNKVELQRAHKEVCKQHHGKEAWIDIHGCYNFVVCRDCKEVLTARRRETIYPELT